MKVKNKKDVISAFEQIEEYSSVLKSEMENVIENEISNAFEEGFDAGINSIEELKILLHLCIHWIDGRKYGGEITVSDKSLIKAIEDFREQKWCS